ncbi:hypothetical protein CJF42_15015 [Pseudoalteromonas sp. NBT06-2]|uniref:SpoIIE family protein phosphatase n=1 Tax=Pseudoalteromonas sp. NBT06-2 TaxID=2025950 RepID=UPI000BA5CF52|nr:SpoIIE family protein phosphatase [Pseudoalteromonas sp. NBT06-2]PAJ73574.1 hypothetical protein CJF42_15015 [Pseudoalteromonas sp. NBT06-2]
MNVIKILKPAIYCMNQLKFVFKFLIICFIFTLPLSILGWALVLEVNNSISTSKNELKGLNILKETYQILFTVAEFRDYSMLQRINLSEDFENEIDNKKKVITKFLSEYTTKIKKSSISSPAIEKQIYELIDLWLILSATGAGVQGAPEIQFTYYDKIVQKIELLAHLISYESKLAYDPELSNFFLIKLLLEDIQTLNRDFGKLRSYGSFALASPTIDSYTYTLLENIYEELLKTTSSVKINLLYTNRLNVDITLKEYIENIIIKSDNSLDFFYDKVIEGEVSNKKLTWQAFFQYTSKHINLIEEFSFAILPTIEHKLRTKIKTQQTKLLIFISLSTFLYLFVTYLIIGMYYSLKSATDDFLDKAGEIAKGNLDVQIKKHSRDELSYIIKAFNNMAQQLKGKQEKLIHRTLELNREKQFIVSVMDTQNNMVITQDNLEIKTANKAFFDFFKVSNVAEFNTKVTDNIATLFKNQELEGYNAELNEKTWVNYINERKDTLHKKTIEIDGQQYVFSIFIDKFTFQDEKLFTIVFSDITELEQIRNTIELINKNIKDSIRYASLIQNSIIPSPSDYQHFVKDSFVFWQPKDIVGGDIYIFDTIRSNDECLFMVIDCTGHGVPGAFVTMLVKAIERQIIANISMNNQQVKVSEIFSAFNKELKKILKQGDNNSTVLSNVGFDGGIVYYNKNKKIIKYSGSNTSLFYIKDNKLNIIKGDKESIGYKSSDVNFKFQEYSIDTRGGMTLYITSDGYLDQNGGEKLFPFGKTRFKNIIKENHDKPLQQQKDVFVSEFNAYKGDEEQTDDITLLAIKFTD